MNKQKIKYAFFCYWLDDVCGINPKQSHIVKGKNYDDVERKILSVLNADFELSDFLPLGKKEFSTIDEVEESISLRCYYFETKSGLMKEVYKNLFIGGAK